MTINSELLSFEPVTEANWDKFAELFGERGACANCWCMYYRLNREEFNNGKKDNGNKEAMHRSVSEGRPVGIIAIYEGRAIAWCAFAPRQDFFKLARSRVHKPIDDLPVWSIPCFFIHKKFRRQGLSVVLLKGVVNYAKQRHIGIVEAYPTIPTQERLPDSFAWIGLYSSFEQAGFEIVDRTSKNRPMVRYYLDKSLRPC